MDLGVEAWIGQLGPTGLLALGIFALLKGWLVPASTVQRVYDAQEARITEAVARENRALDAAEKLYETVELQTEQMDKLMAGQEATLQIIRAWNTERAR